MVDVLRVARAAVPWLLTAALVVYAATGGDGDSDVVPRVVEGGDEPAGPGLRITGLSDADVAPGDAVVVSFAGDASDLPIEARVARRPAEIVTRGRGRVVVRVPRGLPDGKAGLRLLQGTERSRSWDLNVRRPNYRKLIARLLGGLALFLYGLGVLATGVRRLAGPEVRARLGRLTGGRVRAVGVGVLVGGLTQLTSSAAAFVTSLVEARLLAVTSAIAVLVGAQLGAAITGALLPVGLTRDSLIVLAIGVLWMRAARGRRAEAIGQLVVGAALMLYGLHLLQTSVEPLVSDPELLPLLGYLRASGAGARVFCAATGAFLAFVLQGPGPVYGLVLGLAQASGALPLDNALAILAGTGLGAALGVALVAARAGRPAGSLASAHVLYGLAATAFGLVTLPVWQLLGEAVGGDRALLYGHTVARPSISVSLALGFAGSQVCAVGLWLVVLPWLMRRAAHASTQAAVVAPTPAARELTAAKDLATLLSQQRLAVDAAFDRLLDGGRARPAEGAAALAEARRSLELELESLAGATRSPALERLARTLVASLPLQRAAEQLFEVLELALDRGLQPRPEDLARLRAMHALVREGYDAADAALERGLAPDPEAADAREIRLNVLEAEARAQAVVPRHSSDSTAIRLGTAELATSIEHLGNHVYRLGKALGDEDGI